MPASSSSSSAAAANTKNNNYIKLLQRCIGAIISKTQPLSAATAERELVGLLALRCTHAAKVKRQASIVTLAVR